MQTENRMEELYRGLNPEQKAKYLFKWKLELNDTQAPETAEKTVADFLYANTSPQEANNIHFRYVREFALYFQECYNKSIEMFKQMLAFAELQELMSLENEKELCALKQKEFLPEFETEIKRIRKKYGFKERKGEKKNGRIKN